MGARLVSPLYNLLISMLLIRYAIDNIYAQLLFRARACGSTNAKGQSAKDYYYKTKRNKPRSRSATVTWERDSATKCQSNILYSSYVDESSEFVLLIVSS